MTDLSAYYAKQEALDAYIQKEHNETYASTASKRLLALLVELGEFANETRCFKFWSLKGPSAKEIVLDEYADGLHFFFSLGIPLSLRRKTVDVHAERADLTTAILSVYEKVIAFGNDRNEGTYWAAFDAYWDLLPSLGYTVEDALEAYDAKLAVNYKRQENHY